MSVIFDKVSKQFPAGTLALDNLDLEFAKGEFVIFLGPSGSGKTTACRCLAGLEEITSGQILVDGVDVSPLPPRKRNMSMVFQNYALYSHKSVFENIAYPLRVRKLAKGRIAEEVRRVAALLQIEEYLDRRPRQLSGGQAQRVAVDSSAGLETGYLSDGRTAFQPGRPAETTDAYRAQAPAPRIGEYLRFRDTRSGRSHDFGDAHCRAM